MKTILVEANSKEEAELNFRKVTNYYGKYINVLVARKSSKTMVGIYKISINNDIMIYKR